MTTKLDPLVDAAERFALDRPKLPEPLAAPGRRPFGMQFASAHRPTDRMDTLPQWHLCPDTQVAVTPRGVPWYTTVGRLPMSTTGESPDGGPSTGGEEWRPDYQADADAGLG